MARTGTDLDLDHDEGQLAATETVLGELLPGVQDERARGVVIDPPGRLTILGPGGLPGLVDGADLPVTGVSAPRVGAR